MLMLDTSILDCQLVGGLVAIFYFPINIGLLIIPTDFHIFQRGGPTTNQSQILPVCFSHHQIANLFLLGQVNPAARMAEAGTESKQCSAGEPRVDIIDRAMGFPQARRYKVLQGGAPPVLSVGYRSISTIKPTCWRYKRSNLLRSRPGAPPCTQEWRVYFMENPILDGLGVQSVYSHPNIKHPHSMVPMVWKFPAKKHGFVQGVSSIRGMGLYRRFPTMVFNGKSQPCWLMIAQDSTTHPIGVSINGGSQ